MSFCYRTVGSVPTRTDWARRLGFTSDATLLLAATSLKKKSSLSCKHQPWNSTHVILACQFEILLSTVLYCCTQLQIRVVSHASAQSDWKREIELFFKSYTNQPTRRRLEVQLNNHHIVLSVRYIQLTVSCVFYGTKSICSLLYPRIGGNNIYVNGHYAIWKISVQG